MNKYEVLTILNNSNHSIILLSEKIYEKNISSKNKQLYDSINETNKILLDYLKRNK